MVSIDTPPAPSHIAPKHWQEWVTGSQVSPHIAALNLSEYSGQAVIEMLADKPLSKLGPHSKIYVTAGMRRILQRYEGPSQGGWGLFGLDPLNDWQQSSWFRFKPDTPHFDSERQRPVKYESPAGEPTRATFLRVSYADSVLTAERIKDSYETAYCAFRSRLYDKLQQAAKAKGQQLQSSQEPATGSDDDRPAQIFEGDAWFAAARGQFKKAHQILSQAREPIEDEGFWPWVDRFVLPVAIVEGEKKAGAMLSLGIPAIAIPGIRNAVRTRDKEGNRLLEPYLIPELKHFATENREVTVCFDYETRQEQRLELDLEIEKIKVQFSRAKCQVKVLELPGPQKGVDDFIVAHGWEAFAALYDGAPSFELWTVIRYSRLTYKTDLELNQRYLGDIPIPPTAKLIAISSPKGTGKTESFRSLVEEASARGQRTLLITHRVQLGQAICDRVYLPYVTELRSSEEGSLLGYGVCIDSLHPESQARFNAEDWSNALVIIDECEQVVWHLLSATTEVKNRRVEVLKQLQTLLNGVLASDRGRIVLSDADLSDLSLDFVHSLLNNRLKFESFVVANRYQPQEPWEVTLYRQSKPAQWMAALLEHIGDGGKPFVVTQSQKTKSKWSTTTLEKLLNERYPELRVLRIDSQSVADPSHPAYLCTSNLNEVLLGYDAVIASPTIETGVSIDIRGHFTSVWGCMQGVLPENSARQSLARVREPVPRHIWCSPFGVGRVGNGGTSVRSILAAEYKLAKRSAQVLSYAALGDDMISAFGSVLRIWAAMACRINAGAVRYRDSVLYGLQQEGHTVTEDDQVRPIVGLNVDLEKIKREQFAKECEATSAEEEIHTEREYEELKGKKAKTKSEWYKQRKYEIQQRYGQEVTPELVAKDADGWYPQLRLFYYLTLGNSFLAERDRGAFDTQLKSGAAWLPTLNRSQLSLRVKALDYLGIKKLFNTQECFNGGTRADEAEIEAGDRTHYDDAHPLLLEVAEAARKFSWEIRAILGITTSEKMSPIQICQALLGKVGIKLECVCQEGPRGARQRIYRFRQPQDGRAEVLEGWYLRDVSAHDAGGAVHTPGNKEIYSGEAA
ncbi:plasmid replication protein, CyRepA1 family [Pseudanabaena sp. FACHB-2040]|uniref:plasmid replication protein, CyRepA1 family n=1 Tax=Pseudanabaena sp. FACHB-2040 TaxID=2692859 RepID=UPI0016862E70|nr:plasmid replication protein, CyRepA1 family [Pseudanabaena sp. FACHB-2040]MBD2261404.1 DUF3854 domain-containing protein [Pseudanabaena sp. FACHB-2040]